MHGYKLKPWLRLIEGEEGGAAGATDKAFSGDENGGAGDDQITDDDGNVDWKAAARKHERDAKAFRKKADENAIAAQRLAELEEADKSEAQKAADRAASLERERDEIRTEALRWKIAARHGISDADAELFLTGKDEDTITAQAERLKAFNTQHGQKPNPNAGRHTEADKGSVTAGAERYAERHQKTK